MYHNYTVRTAEFEPELNWEVSEHAWVEFGVWPDPLHFGIHAWLQDTHGEKTLRTLIERVVQEK